MNNYYVQNIPIKSLSINGKANADAWKQANVLIDFQSPWDSGPIAPIKFRALYDAENFYFSFCVLDTEVYTDTSANKDQNIGNSDRVELFFRSDASLNPYYCLEIDTTARIMDFEARPGKNFDFDWNWPIQHINVQSSIQNTCFVVEGTISLNSLRDLNLLKENKIEIGVFRAKYNKNGQGEFTPTWIAWVDPKTEDPNFHISSSFGVFHLE
tara:strand:+ start:6615 stop:7250 length:636 start_codon:yes stop_codon:yes gene_type:complete